MAVTAQGWRPRPYSRRRPESTTLYQVVQHHLETELALAREGDGDGQRVPAYLEREFRDDLTCGVLVYGFARARYSACGRNFLVAFCLQGTRAVSVLAHRLANCSRPRLPRTWLIDMLPAAAGAPMGDRRAQATRWYLDARTEGPQCGADHVFRWRPGAVERQSRGVRVMTGTHDRGPPAGASDSGVVSFVHGFGGYAAEPPRPGFAVAA